MRFVYTRKFKELFKELPLSVRRKFSKQISLLAENIRHPSLQTKKIQGHPFIWEARIDYHYRFTFNWEKDVIILRAIGAHDEVLRNP